MLQITIPPKEFYNEATEEFITTKEQTLQLEHSLVSLSKWESKWCKAFYGKEEKTYEETIDYVRCMTLTQNVNPEVYNYLTESNFNDIYKYIESPMTATTFSENNQRSFNRETPTAELIYYWMIAANIPFECQKWHINRLLTLIRVCGVKNSPPKKSNKRDIMQKYKSLNEQRRQKFNSKG